MRSALVGRDRELDALDGWLAAALGGAGRLVLCHGEPGSGRTRLAEEFAVRAAARGVPSRWGRCSEADGSPPYWLWRRVLHSVPGAPDPLPGIEPDLAPLTGRAQPGGPPTDEERFRLAEAVGRVLRAAAAADGLVLVLDDLHAADAASSDVLRHLAADLDGSRLLVLATHHSARGPRSTHPDPLAGVLAELVRQPGTERIELGGLDPSAVAAHLAASTGAPVPAEVAGRVHELTGGNPFFVSELARELAAGRPVGVPPGVRDVVARRTGRLSPRCRHLLRAAAVAGPRFGVALAADMIGRPVLECLDPLDEAVAAGLVEPTGTPGEHRFVHALVRDTVETDLPAGERVRLHHAAIGGIERLHAGRLDPHLPVLARHWAAAAIAGQRAVAAERIERAGAAAVRERTFDEAARLYRLALDTGDSELDGPTRHRLLVALADAGHRCADVPGSVRACVEASAVARELARPDLLADAALVLGCVNDPVADRTLRALCEEALAAQGPGPSVHRARLLARLAETHMYLEEPGPADEASREAVTVAEVCADSGALVAALRARQMVCSGPDGIDERAELTDRLAAAAGDHETRMWAHLWQIDLHVERGALFDAAAELDRLEWCAQQVGGPTARWHVLKVRAALSQAHGRLAEARRLAAEAFAATPADGQAGAVGSRIALLTALDHHAGAAGAAPTALDVLDAVGGPVAAGSGYRITFTLGPAVMLTDAGRPAEAGALYRSLGPPAVWRPPPFFLLVCLAAGLAVAIGQDAAADVAVLRGMLVPYRGLHVGSGAGVAGYGGPVALHLGTAAAHLGELDTAVEDLREALAACRANGAAGYAVEAQAELAAVLARRGRAGDADEARAMAAEGAVAAGGLGMPGFADRLAALAAEPEPAAPSVLTAREREVAGCVARGMSNSEIAASLFLSERTAQNHVQHILSKLGFSRRSQIAVWAVHREPDPGRRGRTG